MNKKTDRACASVVYETLHNSLRRDQKDRHILHALTLIITDTSLAIVWGI